MFRPFFIFLSFIISISLCLLLFVYICCNDYIVPSLIPRVRILRTTCFTLVVLRICDPGCLRTILLRTADPCFKSWQNAHCRQAYFTVLLTLMYAHPTRCECVKSSITRQECKHASGAFLGMSGLFDDAIIPMNHGSIEVGCRIFCSFTDNQGGCTEC